MKKYLILFFVSCMGVVVIAMILILSFGLRDHLGQADVAVVLGSKVELDGSASEQLAARLDRAFDLYKEGYFKTIIVSGGFGKEGYDEATVMKKYLVTRGVPSEQVLLDSKGNTTFDSAKNAALMMRQQNLSRVMVISQYYHLPRARVAFRRFHIPTVYFSYARFFEPRDVFSLLRESIGYPYYYFRSYQ